MKANRDLGRKIAREKLGRSFALLAATYVASMSHGVAVAHRKSLKRKRNVCDKLQHEFVPVQRGKCPILLVPGERIELPTNGLQNRCSTAELTRLFNDLAFSGDQPGTENVRLGFTRIDSQRMRKSSAGATRFREMSRKISLVAVIACAGQSPSCPLSGAKLPHRRWRAAAVNDP